MAGRPDERARSVSKRPNLRGTPAAAVDKEEEEEEAHDELTDCHIGCLIAIAIYL